LAKAKDEFGSIAINEFLVVHSWRNYWLSVLPVTIVVGAVVWACCAWAHARLSPSDATIGKLDEAFIMAMAGAYVWSVYEMLSRFRSRDLTPDDLLEMMLRHLAAVPIGYAFSLLAIDRVAASMAFVSAAFPLRETRLIFRQIALKKLGQPQGQSSRPNEGHLGKVLDGISDLTIIRLEELQIVTYMDLAYMNPVRLIARTGYSLRHVLAWMDQALLVVYAPSLKLELTNVGLPCALDVREFYLQHFYLEEAKCDRDWKLDETVIELAKATEMPAVFLKEIFQRVYGDPHVSFLAEVWYDQSPAEKTPRESKQEIGALLQSSRTGVADGMASSRSLETPSQVKE
jgi:hypothetical protein